jgi:hypothetical protein
MLETELFAKIFGDEELGPRSASPHSYEPQADDYPAAVQPERVSSDEEEFFI